VKFRNDFTLFGLLEVIGTATLLISLLPLRWRWQKGGAEPTAPPSWGELGEAYRG
jgi:hypothetical protein